MGGAFIAGGADVAPAAVSAVAGAAGGVTPGMGAAMLTICDGVAEFEQPLRPAQASVPASAMSGQAAREERVSEVERCNMIGITRYGKAGNQTI